MRDTRNTALVVGGSGFIGTNLTRRLSEMGWEVDCLDMNHPRTRVRSFFPADIREPLRSLGSAGYDAVFNLAAVHRTPGHDDHEYYETNVVGGGNVCEMIRRIEPRVVVFASSISVYGPTAEPLTEESEARPNHAYGWSKLMAERLHLWSRPETTDLRIVRPAVIFGPGEMGNFTRMARALDTRRFALPGRANTLKACGYVEGLIDSILWTMNRSERVYIYNFSFPQQYSIYDIVRAFQATAGYDLPPTMPEVLAKCGIWTLDAIGMQHLVARIEKLRRSTNIVPHRLMSDGFVWKLDLNQALEEWKRYVNGRAVFL